MRFPGSSPLGYHRGGAAGHGPAGSRTSPRNYLFGFVDRRGALSTHREFGCKAAVGSLRWVVT